MKIQLNQTLLRFMNKYFKLCFRLTLEHQSNSETIVAYTS